MITVGVDLAAEPVNTAVAVLDWQPDGCQVTTIVCPANDHHITAATKRASKIAIDCPLGWPVGFVDLLNEHRQGVVRRGRGLDQRKFRRQLTNRRTDEFVQDRFKIVPLSVAADRIAHPAIRAAGLLASLTRAGQQVDRSGSGRLVEVYPAASLKEWKFDAHRGYKTAANEPALAALVAQLRRRATWLKLEKTDLRTIETNDNAFDALIAALTARAIILGQTAGPQDHEDAAAAKVEGWIHVPSERFERLDPRL